MPKRRRLATGIYEDAHGISVVLYRRGRPQTETRFDPDTPLERLKQWRATQIGQAAELDPVDRRGSLARDVVRYLKRLKGLPGHKSERSHLRAWLQVFPRKQRWAITPEMCELVIARWRQHGYSARTIRHRCRALKSLYRRLEGPLARSPIDQLRMPSKPKPRPVSVADDRIEAVALQLRKQEILGRLRDAKTRARFLVLATHSQRPCEMQRTVPATDLDLERRLWFVRTAKGGYSTIVPLNDEQLAAWTLFIEARAQGPYDSRSFSKTLQRNGWPSGIRPYNLRHSTGFALSARGVDLGDIQALMGHTSPDTTRQFYVPGLIDRLARATKALEGRFEGESFHPETRAKGRRRVPYVPGSPAALRELEARRKLRVLPPRARRA